MQTRSETPESRLRRLRLRSWRRGTREMDLILGRFADAGLEGLAPGLLEAFDMLLSENDHDLYRWIAGSDRSSNAVRRNHRPDPRASRNSLSAGRNSALNDLYMILREAPRKVPNAE